MYQTFNPSTAVIIGAYALCRLALRYVLEAEAGVRVTGESATSVDLIDLVRSCEPDVVVLEQSLPRCSAAEALVNLNLLDRPPRLLILVEKTDTLLMRQLCVASHALCLPKSTDPLHLIEHVKALTQCTSSVGKFRGSQPGKGRSVPDRDDGLHHPKWTPELLSATELEIVEELARGAPNKRIASNLGIAEQTVKNHLTSLYRRFQVRNRLELLMNTGLSTAKAMTKRTALPNGKLDGKAPTPSPLTIPPADSEINSAA